MVIDFTLLGRSGAGLRAVLVGVLLVAAARAAGAPPCVSIVRTQVTVTRGASAVASPSAALPTLIRSLAGALTVAPLATKTVTMPPACCMVTQKVPVLVPTVVPYTIRETVTVTPSVDCATRMATRTACFTQTVVNPCIASASVDFEGVMSMIRSASAVDCAAIVASDADSCVAASLDDATQSGDDDDFDGADEATAG